MKTAKMIGFLVIPGAVFVFIPTNIGTLNVDYPNITWHNAGVIPTKFHEGGDAIIFVWLLFVVLSLFYLGVIYPTANIEKQISLCSLGNHLLRTFSHLSNNIQQDHSMRTVKVLLDDGH